MTRPPIQVRLSGICKAFGPVQVLREVDFEVRGGEVHALMGENGAGKSTLMKVLGGLHAADAGRIEIDGQAVQWRSPADAEAHGIAIIHQELNLIPELTVAENLFLGRELHRLGLLDHAGMARGAVQALQRLGVADIAPDTEVSRLSVGQQQMVEIARALMLKARVLILDEPTAALSERETEALFTIMAGLQEQGVAMVYVSHRMEEIFRVCQRVSVLRDGRMAGERRIAETSFDELVGLMVGRSLDERFPKREVTPGAVRLSVQDLSDGGRVRGVNFEVRAGEVLGIAGLMGAGRSEVLCTLFGLSPGGTARVALDGQPLALRDPAHAIASGLAFVTEDRKTQGLVLGLSVRENAMLVHLKQMTRAGVVRSGAESRQVQQLIEQLRIRTRDSELEVGALSGGNQQKVVFAKWLAVPPKVLLLDEPTRGVDVGGKAEIYHIINQLAAQGVAIVMVSSELPEVLAMSDRVLVMHEGRQTAVLEAAQATQEAVMAAASGQPHTPAAAAT